MSDVSGAADAPAPTTEAPNAPETQKGTQSLSEAVKGSTSAPKTPGDAPWSKDLADLGLDPETLSKVDAYMREKVQPSRTQLEQKASSYDKLFSEFTTNDGEALDPNTAAQMASELLNAIAVDPEAAVRDIMKLMQLDPAKFAQVQEEMQEQQDDATTVDETPEELTWVQQQMQREQWAKQDEEWRAHIEQLKQERDGKFGEKLYTLAMAGTGPDSETAMQWYQDAYDEIAAMIQAGEKPTAGPTLGEGLPTPPETPEYGSISDAVKSFAADLKAGRG